jgi:outer membrane protein assembly factor BamA
MRFLIVFLFLFPKVLFAQDFVVVKNVVISGNKKTKEKIILRELAIHAGDTLFKNQVDSLLEVDRQKLANRNLFNEVKLSLRPKTTSEADLIVEVTERWFYFPGLDVSWADRNFNEWWYTYNHDIKRLKYGIYTGIDNLTGNADNLNVALVFGFLRQYGIKYTRPYINAAQKTGLEFRANYSTFNNIQYQTVEDRFEKFQRFEPVRKSFAGHIAITRRTGFYLNQTLALGYNQNSIADSVAILNPDYFLKGQTKQQYFSLNYTLRYDRRDNINYPLKGYLINLQAVKMGLLPTDNINMAYFLGGITYFKPLAKKLFLATSLRARVSFPKNQPYFQRQTTGFGIQNDLVRGYEQYIIDGQSFAMLKNNLRYRILDRSFDLNFMPKQFQKFPLTLYLRTSGDIGYVSNNNPAATKSKLSNKPLLGGGIGIDIVTWYNIVLQMSYYGNQMNEFRVVPKTRSDF